MKRVIVVILVFFVSFNLEAQVFLIDDFVLSATEGAYGIYADIDCEESNVFYIDMQAPNEQQHVQMKLWGNFIDGFISSMRSAKMYIPLGQE